MQLPDKQKRHLRSLGHQLHPVVIIGQKGMRQAIMDEIEIALAAHELIKIKITADDRTQRDQLAAEIATATGASLVQRIGNVALLFRANPEKKKNRIELPTN